VSAELDSDRLKAALAQAERERERAQQALTIAEHGKAVAESATAVLSRLTALTDVTLSAVDLGEMLRSVAAEARRSFGSDGALVAVAEEGTSLRHAVDGVAGEDEDALLDLGLRLRDGAPEGTVATFAGLEGGLQSVLAAPMHATGVLLVGSREPRAWSDVERHLLRLGADRLAVALEQARMRDRERHVAGTLQRALLPPHLPQIDGAVLAARYVPAEHGVGGDWYDAFELPGGRLGLAVGDVVGHGVDAAATAVRLRDELRGFVLQGCDPAGVVAALDALAADERDGAYSSVLYAELDVHWRRARWASAGHMPPVLVRDGVPRVLASPGGTLLGAQPVSPWPQRTEALEYGDRLVLYTDGLVESPGEPLDAAIVDLFTRRTAAAGDLEALCDSLLDARPAAGRDDAAILAVAIC
jgi:phosphoserine phosphatase RsbU/P